MTTECLDSTRNGANLRWDGFRLARHRHRLLRKPIELSSPSGLRDFTEVRSWSFESAIEDKREANYS
jgi:hypothetical protein